MNQATVDRAQEEIDLIKAGREIIAHIRTDANLHCTCQIHQVADEIRGALYEANEIIDNQTADYALDEAIDLI